MDARLIRERVAPDLRRRERSRLTLQGRAIGFHFDVWSPLVRSGQSISRASRNVGLCPTGSTVDEMSLERSPSYSTFVHAGTHADAHSVRNACITYARAG